ncbi:flagellar brake protein [Cellulomonas edaphi]|uniref:PilZ domain-containing protein n=1 Tax=Cellulomonas edaphi TaxID=3053468 RepID=A0ABT7S9Z8_9CELL|nr:PilZ domain-containing protein [Cellulomons edaphi]MDM7832435.1 PilZ domain-containing protein [Cellulomons edaphi]
MHDLARCAITDGDSTLEGYVVAFAAGTMNIRSDHWATGPIAVGDDVEVTVLDEVRGLVTYVGCFARVSALSLQITDVVPRSVVQRRQAARVRVAEKFQGLVASPDETMRAVPFVTVDISAHGARISTSARLEKGDLVAFDFWTGYRTIPLEAEVLWAQETGTGTWHYGCRFVSLEERDSDAMFRYVAQTQGAQRRARLQH